MPINTHLSLGRAVRCAVFAREQRCGQSQPKLYARLLCLAEYLIPRFNKPLAKDLQRATARVASSCRHLLAKVRLISYAAMTFRRTAPPPLHSPPSHKTLCRNGICHLASTFYRTAILI
jgi:hypothetical protein